MTDSDLLRRTIAASAIVLAAVTLSGCSILNGILNGGESDVFSMKVGDCLNDAEVSGTVTTVPIVDCEKPHDSEIYASILMDDGDYPGETEAADFAYDACYEEFDDFMGISYEDSIYDFSYYHPTNESWDTGDREVLCIVYLYDENGDGLKIDGSVEGIEE